MREQIINDLYNSPDLISAFKSKAPTGTWEDLRQEVFLLLCQIPDERFLELYNKNVLKYYIVRITLNLTRHKRSKFLKEFVTKEDDITDYEFKEEEKQDTLIDFETLTNGYHWYAKELFKLFIESRNIKEMAKDLKIPYTSLVKAIRATKKKLKKQIRCL